MLLLLPLPRIPTARSHDIITTRPPPSHQLWASERTLSPYGALLLPLLILLPNTLRNSKWDYANFPYFHSCSKFAKQHPADRLCSPKFSSTFDKRRRQLTQSGLLVLFALAPAPALADGWLKSCRFHSGARLMSLVVLCGSNGRNCLNHLGCFRGFREAIPLPSMLLNLPATAAATCCFGVVRCAHMHTCLVDVRCGCCAKW